MRYGTSAFKRYNGRGARELKFHDDTQTEFTVSATGSVASMDLFNIQQNSTASGRIGRKILVKDIFLRMHVIPQVINSSNGNATVHCVFRFMILVDRQCNGALPNQNDILAGTNIFDYRNLDQSHRFKVLVSKFRDLHANTVLLDPVTPFTTAKLNINSKTWHIGLKNVNIPIMYDASTGAIGDLVSNNIIIYTHTHIAGTSGSINARWEGRIRYSDM